MSRAKTILEGYQSVVESIITYQIETLRALLEELKERTPTPADIKALLTKLDELKQALQTPRAWSNDVIVGTPTPLDGVVGSNLISIGEGKDVDYDISNKYLASIVFELEEYTIGDYVKEIRITNGTDVKVIVKNMSLAFSNKEVEFLSPPYIPSNYWLEVELNLSAPKKYSIALEIVY